MQRGRGPAGLPAVLVPLAIGVEQLGIGKSLSVGDSTTGHVSFDCRGDEQGKGDGLGGSEKQTSEAF